MNKKEKQILEETESQSLFYWNPFCNKEQVYFIGYLVKVAILILLESFLQSLVLPKISPWRWGRNPYFIGILSAIINSLTLSQGIIEVAILILLESFLQWRVKSFRSSKWIVAILILLESFLQYLCFICK